jgi:hypothetical protein
VDVSAVRTEAFDLFGAPGQSIGRVSPFLGCAMGLELHCDVEGCDTHVPGDGHPHGFAFANAVVPLPDGWWMVNYLERPAPPVTVAEQVGPAKPPSDQDIEQLFPVRPGVRRPPMPQFPPRVILARAMGFVCCPKHPRPTFKAAVVERARKASDDAFGLAI